MFTFQRGWSIVFVKNSPKFLYCLFLGTLPKNVFGDVLDGKVAFLDHKNMNLKQLQNLLFFKGVSPWFW